MSAPEHRPDLYGIVARFESPEALVAAAEQTRDAGYTRTDAHVPFPVHGLAEALGVPRSRLAVLVLIAGTLGAIGGYALQYWVSVVAYPVNVGGRPYVSWPSWIPVIFECTVLAAALTAFIGMLALNRLPELYHPVFHAPDFDRASNDGFFLTIEAVDPNFDRKATKKFLQGLGAMAVHEVAP